MSITPAPDFKLPTEIYIRQDSASTLPQIVSRFGRRTILMLTTGDLQYFDSQIEQISESMKRSEIGCIVYDSLPSSPNTEDIDEAVAFAKKSNCDCIIGLGGTESLSAARAVSLLTDNHIFCDDIFTSPELTAPALPFISLTGFPAYGFEIAPVFFVTDIEDSKHRFFFDNRVYPAASVVDPTLGINVPEKLLLNTSLASLSVAIESVISRANNDIINTYSLKSIDITFKNLQQLFNDPENITLRLNLVTASLMTGIAFSTARSSVAMALAFALSSVTGLDIETGAGIMLPHILEYNLTSSPGKYVHMAKVMGEDVRDITVIEAAIKAVEAVRKIESDIGAAQRLSDLNIHKSQFRTVAERAAACKLVENSPRQLNASELETILISAF